ncbi:right-handed parallel beta-helix repeat-containing protein [Streptomyces spectabilis]|uniref:Right handed beta helix domain-containing protein n=1 Tax=Streptomyces spectabilis TaxID=68270 RepID=A0A516RF82_STRST|nr:right-handed parallel beta-helix repeat-containing protein [Streptomyces spectabilis]QDQ14316.1 hypothetical protein FH965_30195 [Streptomyces spectabilis]
MPTLFDLPASVPSVTLRGKFIGPDGRPQRGIIEILAPTPLTFGGADVFISGPIAIPLDAEGGFVVKLPATDSGDANPKFWAYTITERLVGITDRQPYGITLPAAKPDVWLNDIAPSNPYTPEYVPITGPKGDKGDPGAGNVNSVNGKFGPDISLTNVDLGALASAGGTLSGKVQFSLATPTDTALGAFVTGDGFDRFRSLINGRMEWGSGSSARDTFLYRSDVRTLATDGSFVAQNIGGMMNVRAFGATGSGTIDDAPFIQAALNFAKNFGGWVVLPPGIYNCATLPLRIYGGTRLTLLPGATLRRGGTNTFLLNGDAAQNLGGYNGHGNIVIEGGLWDMRSTANPTDPDMCISIGHARNVIIRDLEIRDVGGYHGIELNSTKHALISNCLFRGYTDTGGRDFSEAIQLDGAFRPSVFGGFGPYDGTPCEDITVRDCYTGPSGTTGTVAWPAGVGSHSAAAGLYHKRIRVEANTFEGGAQYAVKPYIWENSTVIGNTIKSMGSGIWARTLDSSKVADRTTMGGTDTKASQSGTGLVIANNTFRDIGAFNHAIFVEGETTGRWYGVTISGNTVSGAGGNNGGLRLVYLEGFTATGNALSSIGGTGMSTANCSDGVLSTNRMFNCGGSFFTSDTGARLSVMDNNAGNCGSHGFWAWDNTDLRMSGNYIRGAGRSDATAQGIRLSTGGDRIAVTNNTYRKWGSGTEAASPYTCTSTVTNVRRWGNDWGAAITSTPGNEATSVVDIVS